MTKEILLPRVLGVKESLSFVFSVHGFEHMGAGR